MAKRGRRTKLTPQNKERFLQAIGIGATYEDACQYAGISFQTLMNWEKRREKEFVDFFESISAAEGRATIGWLAILEKHASIDPKWAAWKLERRHPDKWGNRQKHEHSGKVDSTVTLQDWRQQTAASRKQAAAVVDDFADDTGDDSE